MTMSDKPALKHGFYSHQFKRGEEADLETLPRDELAGEINMLRVTARRLLAMSEDVEDIETMIATLNALGLASTRVANMLKSHKAMSGRESEMSKALDEALELFLEEQEAAKNQTVEAVRE